MKQINLAAFQNLPARHGARNGIEVLVEVDERIVEIGEDLPLILERLQNVVQGLDVVPDAPHDPSSVARTGIHLGGGWRRRRRLWRLTPARCTREDEEKRNDDATH